MFHLSEKSNAELEVKKSRFICLLFPISQEIQIKETIAQVKKEYPSAKHYCYACSINGTCRSNDDGEPASTAGKPILQHLLNHELDNVLAVVVRYFGGTLLGTAGLIKAYGDVTEEAIQKAKLTIPVQMNVYQIEADYALLNKIEYVLEKNGQILKRDYFEQVSYQFACEKDITDQLMQASNGQVQIKFIEEIIVEKITGKDRLN